MKKSVYSLLLLGGLFLFGLSSCSKSGGGSSKCVEVCKPVLGANQTAAATAAGIVGKYTLTYDEILSGGAFTNGDKIEVDLKSKQLTVTFGDKCVTIENPYNPYGPGVTEVTFRDECVFQVLFAASEDQNGKFNEIKISTLGGQFLGQFKE